MKRDLESIRLNFSEPELAQAIADFVPPVGVEVSRPVTLIQAAEPAQVVTQFVLHFVPEFSAALLAGWILQALEKRGDKRARINRKEIPLTKSALTKLIKDERASQKARTVQLKADKILSRKRSGVKRIVSI